MSSRWSSILFAAVCAAIVGCTSPTLPLPPPVAPSEASGTEPGTVVLHGLKGSVPAGSTIIIYNLTPNPSENLGDTQKVTATLVHDDGSWDATIFGIKGDFISVYDIEEGEWSASTTFTVSVN